MEIERKWILNGFPEGLKEIKEVWVKQTYLNINPEVRIRKYYEAATNHIDYKMCIKGDGDLSRIEVEKYITELEYNSLMSMTDKKPISKICKVYDLGYGLRLECSIVDEGTENEFYYAEVEFMSKDLANLFILPFDAVEVTNDKSYKMKNYWTRTRLNIV